jgi:hypothetical protein
MLNACVRHVLTHYTYTMHAYFRWENIKSDHVEDLGEDGMIILKYILKSILVVCDGNHWCSLVNTVMHLWVLHNPGSFLNS